MLDLFLKVDDFDPREFIPCSELEIDELMKIYDFQGAVPLSLAEFLRFGGHRIADMRPLSEFYYESMVNMKKRFLTGVNSKFPVLKISPIPRDGFLFCGSEGYYYEFIMLSEGDDPKVHAFDDDPDRDTFDLVDHSFTNSLETFIKKYLIMHQKRISDKETLRKHINRFKSLLLDAIELVDQLRRITTDDYLEQVQRFYYAIRRDIYLLYDSTAKISFEGSLKNAKIIELMKINSLEKLKLLELDDKLHQQYVIMKETTANR